MVSQSVEQWCAQTEKEQADTVEVQIIAYAVKFEKVYRVASWFGCMATRSVFSARKYFLKAKILDQKEININECQK